MKLPESTLRNFLSFKSSASEELPLRSAVESRNPNRALQWREQNHRFLAEKSAIVENTATLSLAISSHSNASRKARPLHYRKGVTLKIENTTGEGRTIIKLIGRIRAEHLDKLKAQITASVPEIVLKLGEVSLVDADAVRFLSACEAEGILLLNCSVYIREWIVRQQESSSKG